MLSTQIFKAIIAMTSSLLIKSTHPTLDCTCRHLGYIPSTTGNNEKNLNDLGKFSPHPKFTQVNNIDD